MALIICEDCGKEFSDKASACPNCGCPPKQETRKLIVSRVFKAYGKDVTPKIYIDEKLMGVLENGQTIEYDLTIGEHTFGIQYYVKPQTGFAGIMNGLFGVNEANHIAKQNVERIVITKETKYIKITTHADVIVGVESF